MEDFTSELCTGRSLLTTASSEFKFTASFSSIKTNATQISISQMENVTEKIVILSFMRPRHLITWRLRFKNDPLFHACFAQYPRLWKQCHKNT